MERFHIISVISACLFLFCAASRAEQGKAASRKIVLEDEEVTLLDGNGKELERRTTSKTSKEKAAINKQVREQVLKSLGIKSVDELKGNRQLAQRYFKESAKFVKVKKLNPTRLKFLDEQGRLSKEVPIGYSTTVSTIGAEMAEARKSLWGARASAGRKIEERKMRTPTVASSQNAAIIAENVSNFAVAQSATEEKALNGTEAANLGAESSLEYYDAKGDKRWKKTFDYNRVVSEGRLSGDGAKVAVVEGCEMNCSNFKEKGIPIKRLAIFDSAGKEEFGFSLSSGACQSYGGDFWLSQDGNYAIVSCLSDKKIRSIVFNIPQKSIWKAPYLISVNRGEDGAEIGSGNKIRIVATDEQMKNQSMELDLGGLSWEKLP